MSSIRSASSRTKISRSSSRTNPCWYRSIGTARRGHQNIHAAAQGLHLGVLAHAAEDDGVAQGQVCPIGGEALADLDGQLPGGREDQGAEPVVRRPGLAQPLEGWGEAKAQVLPVPVWAQPVRPAPPGGMACSWMGEGLIALLLQRRPKWGRTAPGIEMSCCTSFFFIPARGGSQGGPRFPARSWSPAGWGQGRPFSRRAST